MKKQLQGIALILFGILLMMFSIIDPWVPIVDDLFTPIAFWAGLVSGIIGLVLSFQKENSLNYHLLNSKGELLYSDGVYRATYSTATNKNRPMI